MSQFSALLVHHQPERKKKYRWNWIKKETKEKMLLNMNQKTKEKYRWNWIKKETKEKISLKLNQKRNKIKISLKLNLKKETFSEESSSIASCLASNYKL